MTANRSLENNLFDVATKLQSLEEDKRHLQRRINALEDIQNQHWAIVANVISLTDHIEEYTAPYSGECRLSIKLGETVYVFPKHTPEVNPFLEVVRQLFLLAEKEIDEE